MNERLCMGVSKFALSTTTDWGKNHFNFFSQDGITYNKIQVQQVTAALQK